MRKTKPSGTVEVKSLRNNSLPFSSLSYECDLAYVLLAIVCLTPFARERNFHSFSAFATTVTRYDHAHCMAWHFPEKSITIRSMVIGERLLRT